MKKLLPLLLLALVACNKNKNTPTEPIQPSYIGLPIASYNVVTTNEVQPTGVIPIGSMVQFSSTYTRKNQLTGGNAATLTLTGIKGIRIRSITLFMHSNKSAGAGNLTMTNGEQTVWSIDDAAFSSNTWYGAYSSESVPVFHLFDPYLEASDKIEITIEATVNSLYIMRYDIEYEPREEKPLTRDDALVSGLKVFSFPICYRWTGPVQDKYVYVKSDSLPIESEDLYEVTYYADSTATLYHPSSQTFIGCHKGVLDQQLTRWSVKLSPDTTFTFYVQEEGRYYQLMDDPMNEMNLFLMPSKGMMRQCLTLRSYSSSH